MEFHAVCSWKMKCALSSQVRTLSSRFSVCVFGGARRPPVQPGQQTLGGGDQLHHGGQELVGGLMGDLVVVGGVLPALRHGGAQAVVRRSHLGHQTLQVVRLHAVVLQRENGGGDD